MTNPNARGRWRNAEPLSEAYALAERVLWVDDGHGALCTPLGYGEDFFDVLKSHAPRPGPAGGRVRAVWELHQRDGDWADGLDREDFRVPEAGGFLVAENGSFWSGGPVDMPDRDM